jgi:peptidoglycan/LPS O-acetylase OafA/YrhL
VLFHIHGFVTVKSGLSDAPQGMLMRLAGEGSFGVPLFFALSGYILCRPFLGGRTVSLKRYFARRLSRLEPPFLINLLLAFALELAVLDIPAGELAPHLAASMVYSHNLVYGTLSLVNGVTWSLEIEWQFYLLAPLAFAWVARSPILRRHVGLVALTLAGGLVFAATDGADQRFQLSLLRYFGFFAAGMWIATLDEDYPRFGRDSAALDGIGIAAWTGLAAILLDHREFSSILPILTAIIVLCGIRGRFFSRVLGWWPVYCIGAMCYTIYLYHFFIISLAGRVFMRVVPWPESLLTGFFAFASVAVPTVLVACAVPYLLVERPFMIWRPGRNRLIDAFRRGDAPEATARRTEGG